VSAWKTLAQGAGVGLGVLIVVFVARFVAEMPTAVRGAVVTADAIPTRESPLANVEIEVSGDPSAGIFHSDASGFFTIPISLHHRVPRGTPITLDFHLSGYQPLELHGVSLDKLCIARLTPLPRADPSQPEVSIANVVAKYSISNTSMVNIGSAVKTFSVVNTGNVACQAGHPCSPDGKWSATVGSTALDAGRGNEFRNARATCIAGPCPFTRIQNGNLSSPGQTLHVSALDWSDTATFLLEAEVFRPVTTDVMRESYPVMFGRTLTFTLPATAEGVSIQAELDKNVIVFPLGPALTLSWANCQLQVNKDQTKVYRCDLKPGYRFS
jgi:hypothetical protein